MLQHPITTTRPQLRHTWQETDTLADVAARYGVYDPEDILDLNRLEETDLSPGMVLLISRQVPKDQPENITYEVLETPVVMHVNKPEGIQQYSFGNITNPNDVPGKGHFPHKRKITVHAIARVPVGDEELAYYMDGHAFGKYRETGKVAWNVGYAWSELSEGEYQEPPEIEPIPTILDEPDVPDPTIFDEIIEEQEPEPAEEPARQDDVLVPLNADYSPVKYLFEQDIELCEVHAKVRSVFRRKLDPVWIIATFTHDGEEYYQPGKTWGETVQSGLLWPIPMDSVLPEDEVFNYDTPRRNLTRQEKAYELLAKLGARYTTFMDNHKHKN